MKKMLLAVGLLPALSMIGSEKATKEPQEQKKDAKQVKPLSIITLLAIKSIKAKGEAGDVGCYVAFGELERGVKESGYKIKLESSKKILIEYGLSDCEGTIHQDIVDMFDGIS